MRSYFSEQRKIYLLNDDKIKSLTKDVERFVINQRKYKHLFQVNEKTKSVIVDEDPKILAVNVLTACKIQHTFNDVVKLSDEIKKILLNLNNE